MDPGESSRDTMIGQAFKTAEKHCSKQPRPPWSEKLHHASLRVRYWKIVLTERPTRVSQATTVLRRLVAEIWLGKTAPTIPRSTRILKMSLRQPNWRCAEYVAVKERGTFLQELKARLALRMSLQSTDVDAAIKTIDRQLAEGCRFCRIAKVVKPSTPAALTKVEIVTTQSHLHPHTGQVVDSKTVKLVDT
jgi:hypothetical protein